ncbi:MAG: hypothetical protein COW42_03170 [Deltaproteobacteria bacterium CG17_big_fil_post_rev_8_21_14_2_50_63_7]|nr:MAG: hypothetical protein COW42_03170 [Deltaproteobacteria bacterium CG17_big_fil_post_rev_8_21_14_2_50_63_7]
MSEITNEDQNLPLDEASDLLQKILTLAGYSVAVTAKEEDGNLVLDVPGTDARALINRPGGGDGPVFLDALSQIIRRAAFKDNPKAPSVIVDAAGYREARVDKMKHVAQRLSGKIIGGLSADVYGMNSVDRRTVHRQLSEGSGITTSSEGMGIFRRLKVRADRA